MRKRWIAFAAAASCFALICPDAGAQPFPVTQGKSYKFEKVADGVYYASGGVGSNNVVIVNDDDVLIVDDGSTPAAARAFVADIKLLTDKPIRTVVNTHFHYDHTNGNQIFGPGVQIIGHEYIRKMISDPGIFKREPYLTSLTVRFPETIASLTKSIATEMDAVKKSAMAKELASAEATVESMKELKATPPNMTYTSSLVLHKGSREIQLLFLGRGHTGGDTFVYLPKEKIICTGDEEEGARVAYMGDAVFDEWLGTLEALKAIDFNLVLPGHGVPFRDKRIITAFQSYLVDIVAQAAILRKQGVSADEAAKRLDLTSHSADLPDITGPGAEVRGVRHLYDWLTEHEKK